MFLGNKEIVTAYVGEREISGIYLGRHEIWNRGPKTHKFSTGHYVLTGFEVIVEVSLSAVMNTGIFNEIGNALGTVQRVEFNKATYTLSGFPMTTENNESMLSGVYAFTGNDMTGSIVGGGGSAGELLGIMGLTKAS